MMCNYKYIKHGSFPALQGNLSDTVKNKITHLCQDELNLLTAINPITVLCLVISQVQVFFSINLYEAVSFG